MVEETNEQLDMAGLTMAQAFGVAALPPGLSAAAIAAIETQANFAQRLPGADRFLMTARNGFVGQKSAEDREEEEAKDALEFFGLVAEEQKREREEWARSSHEFAGIELTGEEWGELGDELRRDTPLRQWLISRMVRDGKTNAQAVARVEQFADVFTALSKPPSQRTPGENAAIERARSDPDFQRYTSQTASQQFGRAELSGSGMRNEQTSSTADRGTIFGSAPNLSARYTEALAATVPLEAPQAGREPTRPLIPASAGLDV